MLGPLRNMPACVVMAQSRTVKYFPFDFLTCSSHTESLTLISICFTWSWRHLLRWPLLERSSLAVYSKQWPLTFKIGSKIGIKKFHCLQNSVTRCRPNPWNQSIRATSDKIQNRIESAFSKDSDHMSKWTELKVNVQSKTERGFQTTLGLTLSLKDLILLRLWDSNLELHMHCSGRWTLTAGKPSGLRSLGLK